VLSNPDSNALEWIADATIRFDWQGRVTVGHCCSLACRSLVAPERTIARVAAAGIAVVSLPMCNMYLQDRRQSGRTPRWRGVTLLHELAAAGVSVAIGSDNTRDPFHAYGDLDPVEVFAQAVRIAQLDSPLNGWARAITVTRASGLRSPDKREEAIRSAQVPERHRVGCTRSGSPHARCQRDPRLIFSHAGE
jgi:cytosine deaminase